jgi:hypothetical protein
VAVAEPDAAEVWEPVLVPAGAAPEPAVVAAAAAAASFFAGLAWGAPAGLAAAAVAFLATAALATADRRCKCLELSGMCPVLMAWSNTALSSWFKSFDDRALPARPLGIASSAVAAVSRLIALIMPAISSAF